MKQPFLVMSAANYFLDPDQENHQSSGYQEPSFLKLFQAEEVLLLTPMRTSQDLDQVFPYMEDVEDQNKQIHLELQWKKNKMRNTIVQ